jgi:hypothetical protein
MRPHPDILQAPPHRLILKIKRSQHNDNAHDDPLAERPGEADVLILGGTSGNRSENQR